MSFNKFTARSLWIPPVLAVLFVFVFNSPLLKDIWLVLDKLEKVSIGFALSLPVFLLAVFNLVFVILCWRRTTKPLGVVLILLSSILTYAAHTYGVIFDKNMIMNLADTNAAESLPYLNLPLVLWFIGLGVIPSLILIKTNIEYPPVRRMVLQKLAATALSFTVVAIIALFYFKDYASVIRNNPVLRKEIVPSYALDSAYGYIRRTYFPKKIPHQSVGLDALQGDPDIGEKKELLVLIVGETQRAMNYELNGYPRPTDTYTKKHDVISFPNTTSCGTATAVSLPCMFSNLTHAKYDLTASQHRDNLLDIIRRTDTSLLWLDNDSGCKGVCAHIPTIDLREKYKDDSSLCNADGCYDAVFLKEFDERLKTLPDRPAMVILHMMGSHGPSYFERYPEAHRVFKPDCQRSDIQNCTKEELVNTYDNTILYSDYVIGGIIDILKKNGDRWNSAVMFMSDHGESLGEKGVYLHGMPYSLAPDEQIHIPFLLWMMDAFAADRGIDLSCVRTTLKDKHYSHDNFFYTVLGLVDIRAGAYRPDMDVLAPCRVTPEHERAEKP